MPIPQNPKIFHIVHVDRLSPIISDGFLRCDAKVRRNPTPETSIGLPDIKQRRLTKTLSSHADLHVGDCVPFYFCPRSVMLYVISKKNHPNLTYRRGQEPIVHIVADLKEAVDWANENRFRWAFTLSNAGSFHFEDRCNLEQLGDVNWNAVQSTRWGVPGVDPLIRDHKQAEFLIEDRFPWQLVSHVGVMSKPIYQKTIALVEKAGHKPRVQIKTKWYY